MFQLKEYQQNAKQAMEQYFQILSEEKEKVEKLPEEIQREYAINYPEKAWHILFPEQDKNHEYLSKTSGHDKACPNFCLKIPTGGGKTLLATYAIELFQQHIRKNKTGLILWVVPSEQIYTQTLKALKDRAHPYREKLDQVSGNRTKIITKTEKIAPDDVEENLVVLMMMLQSFSREKMKKEILKFFQDSGKFDEFFPLETNQEKQEQLFEKFQNLDLETEFDSLMGGKIKTSFGNVVKILEPLVILDEGHKARSELAKSAISECNPACVCELTATPTESSNILFSVAGRELEKEGMIKLDLNLTEKETIEWKMLVNHTIEHLNSLQQEADVYKEKTGVYIRPINLIQVEATGRDQRKAGKIHADDVKEYLISTGLVREDEVAIKTSSQNDIEGKDVLSDQCPIRFIITKQALQEGWDCSFAYSLTVLAGSKSKRALTQLVGRVLRQPYGYKTKMKKLDESYVFCLKDSSKDLIKNIKRGFEYDGMGDLTERISNTDGKYDPDLGERKKQEVKEETYKKSLKEFVLPAFVVQDNHGKNKVRIVDFTLDILPRIDFSKINFERLKNVVLPEEEPYETVTSIGFSREIALDNEEFLAVQEKKKRSFEEMEFRKSFWVRNLLDYIPNPWVAGSVVDSALKILKNNFSEKDVNENQVFLLEELRKILGGAGGEAGEVYRLAKEVFLGMLKKDEMRFILKFDQKVLEPEYYFEKEERDKMSVCKNLFDPVISARFNEFEKEAAWEMDHKDKTFWWYRNQSKKDFYLMGWQKNKFYPDFIFTLRNGAKDRFASIYLVETKGEHLLGNVDTTYKQELMKLYKRDIQEPWKGQTEIAPKTPVKVKFEFIEETNLQNAMNKIFV
jgi:type III restriction enzyme